MSLFERVRTQHTTQFLLFAIICRYSRCIGPACNCIRERIRPISRRTSSNSSPTYSSHSPFLESSAAHAQQRLHIHGSIPLPQMRLVRLDGMHGHAIRELVPLRADVPSDVGQFQLRLDVGVHGIGSLDDAEVLDLPIGLAPAFFLPARRPLRHAVECIGRVAEYL